MSKVIGQFESLMKELGVKEEEIRENSQKYENLLFNMERKTMNDLREIVFNPDAAIMCQIQHELVSLLAAATVVGMTYNPDFINEYIRLVRSEKRHEVATSALAVDIAHAVMQNCLDCWNAVVDELQGEVN